MDEVLFRSAQKVENLQLRAELAATNAKDVLVVYTQQSKVFLLGLWNNQTLEQLRNSVKNGANNIIVVANDLRIRLVHSVNPKEIYQTLVNVFSKKWTKRDFYFGCSGLIIGCFIGLALGLSLRKKESIIRYMQAIQCSSYLGPESVTVVEDAVAPSDCGEQEVLVNVRAASVQIIDTLICSGYGKTYRRILRKIHKQSTSDLPVILGRDCTGVIVDIGDNVKRLEVGDEVWLTVPFWSQGTLCQTVLVNENRVARKPKNIGFEGACSLPYAGSLALSALTEAEGLYGTVRDKNILVLGGCTPVGCVLVQLLNHWNATITTTCYKRAVPVVKALGVSEFISLTEISANNNKMEVDREDINSVINVLEKNNSKFDVIFNTNINKKSAPKFSKFLNSGRIISTLPVELVSDSCGIFSTYFLYWFIWLKYKLQNALGLPMNNFDETHLCYATLDQLGEFVEDGHLQTVVDKVYQPQDIEIALHHIRSVQSIGSTVVTFR